MPAPKIKLYVLPRGYDEATDSDVQLQSGDELLPVVEKGTDLKLTPALTPVVVAEGVALQPVDTSGPQTYPLVPSGAAEQAPDGTTIAALVTGCEGVLAVKILDQADVEIPPYNEMEGDPAAGETRWVIDGTNFRFLGTAPENASVVAYAKAATPATTWALPSDQRYTGTNTNFNRILISVDSGERTPVDPAAPENAWVVTTAASAVKVWMTYVCNQTHNFIGDHGNWITDHLDNNPDVFVGTVDYPGDSYKTVDGGGNEVIQNPGVLPKHVDPSSYQLRAREGMVIFPQLVDHSETPVAANYAYLADVANVTGQKLDEVAGSDGKRFKADTEPTDPTAHGKRWVARDDAITPINVYVDGVLTPTPRSVAPYDVLTVKTAS